MMTQIEQGTQTREHVIQETINYLKPIVEELKTNEDEIGKELTTIIRESWQASITLSVPCPNCGSKLRVVKNPNTKKRFIGCSGKWEKKCTFSLPLPQLGTLTLLAKHCPECRFQMVQVRSKGRRPMISCSNCFVNKSMTQEPSKVAIHPKLQE
jgi:DNA topoisomerase-1